MTDGLDDIGLPPLGARRLGDNNPPEPTPLETAEQLIPACDEWTSKGPLTSEDEARVLTEFVVQIRKAREALRAGDTPERQQHLDALAAIRATVAHLMEPHEQALEVINARCAAVLPKLDIAIERINGSKKVTGLLADWMAREKQRRAAEAEARRLEAEQAERIAQTMKDKAALSGTIDAEVEAQRAVEVADEARDAADRKVGRVRVRGDLAPKAMSLHAYWSAEIVDWKLAGQHYKKNQRVIKAYRDAVQAAANKDASTLKDKAKAPPGVEFHVREQAQ
jgi:polyhydroxyalkanoate synthesis regulator phasin